ncbi:hypothetical protein BDZ90DRAFT_275016 [Jaminaea rosea]|uniref:DEK C-terminal domain-containing protein n=1 Tax=Jaminaea rosea TaxID=1569628 RepID=A0A316UQU7_9BASI|nr:hypothetical protein BDZ90DRAFT_275016 [Jaminaea rosea]PWN26681.1 hypothetical protein BDZ90DRAFT_275016 [Jaminaea rosea]
MAELPQDDDIVSFVAKFVREDHRKNGQITVTVRKIRAALADHFEVDDDALKEHKSDVIKGAAEKAVAAVEEVGSASGHDQDGSDDDGFSSLDDDDGAGASTSKAKPKKKAKTPREPKAKKATKSSKKAETSSSDPQEEEMARLKKFVVACGVRKQWSKWFTSMEPPAETPKAQIRALRELLAEVGMEGRLSMEKAKQIKEKREFEEEMKAIGADMPVSDDGGGRGRRKRTSAGGSKKPYKDDDDDDDDGDDDEEGESGDDADEKPVKKKRFNASLAAFAAELNSDDDDD